MAAVAALSPYGALLARATEAGAAQPGSLPDPSRPAGVPTDALPFDHIVIVMMENHSFDNYLGMLPRRGKPAVDGFAFDATGTPVDSNPVQGGYITVKRAASRCQPDGPSQAWTPTHHEIDGGRMDGFARVAPASMLYWDSDDIPFYYSLARTFCVGDRWFCSAPCQTYPNRRFLLAGTAFGLISTDTSSLTQNPPNGTIVDRLVAHGISWRDYFTDLPATGVIESIPQNHPANLAPISQFYADCAAGTLPAVSFVDSDIGAASVAGGEVGSAPAPFAPQAGDQASTQNQDEEGPADITLGENFVSQVTNAVLQSPAWPRTLLVWTYDEHGGYYDHVPPPAAIPPDSIPPKLGPHDTPGGYDIYGPRVPAVVVSPYAKRSGVTSVVHDHTSILATIEAKWNLPAMTFRDANANTLADFLDPEPAFLEPPTLSAPGDIASSESTCSLAEPTFTVHSAAGGRVGSGRAGRAGALLVRFLGRRTHVRGVLVQLRMTRGTLTGLTVELVGGHGRVVASTKVARLGTRSHRVALRRHRGHIVDGVYRLVVKRGRRTLFSGRARLTSRHRAARHGEAAT
jgi:phospholipase C